jgi:hypothetical protein
MVAMVVMAAMKMLRLVAKVAKVVKAAMAETAAVVAAVHQLAFSVVTMRRLPLATQAMTSVPVVQVGHPLV